MSNYIKYLKKSENVEGVHAKVADALYKMEECV